MNSTFHDDLAKDHGDALRRAADHARLVRAAHAKPGPARAGSTRLRHLLVFGAVAGSAAPGATYSTG
jgi:hypothetical protein